MRPDHRLRIWGALVVAAGLAVPAGAERPSGELRLEVSVAGAAVEARSLAARVLARPVGSVGPRPEALDVAPVEREARVPGPLSLPLARGVTWSLRLEVPGYWHVPEVVTVPFSGEPSPLATSLASLVPVLGSIVPEARREVPESVRCSFRPSGRAAGGAGLELEDWQELPASRSDGRVRCEVPAGTVHLKIKPTGFVPLYFWDLEPVTGEPLELGELRLRKGASLVGEVRVEGRSPDEMPRVSLQPTRLAMPAPSTEERLDATAAVTRVNSHGFFQLEGIAPGSYVLKAEAPGLATVTREAVELLHEAEYLLDEPLLLRPPSDLELEIVPAVHPYGVPWTVELLARSTPQVLHEVARSEVATSGLVRFSALPPGEYEIVVRGPGRSPYAFETVELVADRQVERIVLPLVEVSGELRLGDEPLSARVHFGGRDGRQRIAMEADADGAFTGHLPRAGTWAVDVQGPDGWVRRAAAIEVPAGHTRVDVTIELPGGVVAGEVVDEEGTPVAGAGVLILDTADRRPALRGTSDAEGAFRVPGVAAGSYLAHAGNADARSDFQPVLVGDEEARAEVRLVLRRQRTVRGRVSGPLGPIPGARVEVLPDAAPGVPAFVAQAVTDPDGGFVVDLPAAAASARVVVHPPGHALSIRRVDLAAPGALELAVTAEGGTLILNLPSQQEHGALFHSGVELPLSFLLDWARMYGAADVAGGTILAPNVQPGEVRLCFFDQAPEPGDTQALEDCPSGHLLPGGLLALGRERSPEEVSP